jgi:O-antigen ligase
MTSKGRAKITGAAFLWLSAFYVVYCARPEDWVSVLGVVPLAKITGIMAFLAFVFGSSKGNRKLRDLPIESFFLLAMICIFLVSSFFSPVSRGQALDHALDFAKVYMVWVFTFLLLTDLPKFRRILYIQAASVPVVCILSMVKGYSRPRLDAVLGGIYSNPNDLAFAIVLSLPFCLMFLLTTHSKFYKLLWSVGMLAMLTALLKTGSRGGFITLIVVGIIGLWHFSIKGKRYYLIALVVLAVVALMPIAGGVMQQRLFSLYGDKLTTRQEKSAQDSFEERQFLIEQAIAGIKEHPVLGVGVGSFEAYSTVWREVHMTYLQVGVEGGIPCLILYLLFFYRGFWNLRQMFKRKNLSPELKLFLGALNSSLVGFAFGAVFSPEAYQFFPYFAVAYTSALLAYVRETERAAVTVQPAAAVPTLRQGAYAGAGIRLHP